jgi:predicted metal-dependent hydrolase
LIHFHATRDYFECHELLEEYWKSTGMEEEIWVALIQVAVGVYHARRGNRKGAIKMWQSAIQKLRHVTTIKTGLSLEELHDAVIHWTARAESNGEFEDPMLPFVDVEFEQDLMQTAKEKGYQWGSPSNSLDKSLIHRHTLRDRTAVIAAREALLLSKRSIAIDDKL